MRDVKAGFRAQGQGRFTSGNERVSWEFEGRAEGHCAVTAQRLASDSGVTKSRRQV
jgi:hypothetical protein